MADQASKAVEKTKEQAGRVQQQSRSMAEDLRSRAPNKQQLLGLATILVGGAALAGVGGMMILATIATIVVGTPIFILFSPILVPLGIVAFVTIAGIVGTLAFIAASASAVAWIYKYAKGRHPVGADQLEAAKHRIMDTATHVTEKAREYGSLLQQKVQDVAPGA